MSFCTPAPIVGATLWMFGAIISFSTMAIAGRELSAELTTFQILFFRSLAGFVLMVVLLSRTGWWQLKTKHFAIHVIRNVAHYGGQYGWFYGIALIPLAEVFAIEFTMPIWTAIFAALMLGERISKQRVVAIAIGFAGVLVMLRPGIAVVSPVALAVLAAALAYGFAHALTKRLSGTDPPMAILFYTTAVQLPLAFIPALHDWTWPSLAMWPWVLGVGTAALAAHYCLTRAFMLEDAAVVMPIDFLRLPFIAVIGFIFYNEPLEFWIFVGAAIVFTGSWLNLKAGSGSGMSVRQTRARKTA
ncbi:MAG: DMT family transporter [Betaproteobacteria bacterium]|nr:MAG: DMT family transporter [Betaproteobacteria bacterium]